MAVITLTTIDDFKKVLKYVNSNSHLAITDSANTIWLVPLKSSRHRHYFIYKAPSEKQLREILQEIGKQGIEIIQGEVQVKE